MMTYYKNTLIGAVAFMALALSCDAFMSQPRSSSTPALSFTCTIEEKATSTSLFLAKRRRRRRKSDSEKPQINEAANSNQLPDFDIADGEGQDAPKKKTMVNVNSRDIKPDEITSAMMGSTGAPDKSLKDLIGDRSLESKFEFDENEEDVSIPDFTTLAQASNGAIPEPGKGKKRARQAARKAAAIAAKEQEEEQRNPLEEFSFLTDEKGNLNTIKILEAGAWTGIFLLVAWEIYLNSPFFDRAAPMAPVVYEILM